MDLWLNRGDTTVIEALERPRAGEVRVWVAASGLPILHYVCRSELEKRCADGVEAARLTARLIQSLLGYASILSVQGFQQPDLLSAAKDQEDAQIAAAATVLHGQTRMDSNDATFDALGTIPVLGPDAALSWLDAAPPSSADPDFIDLKTQQDLIWPQLEPGIHRILHYGQYIMGPDIGELEARLAE